MNRPHFAICNRTDSHSSGEQREYRGNVMFDTPRSNDQQSAQFTPDVPSINQLRQMMHRQPEMTAEQAAEIRRKLEDGTYLTRRVAEESAGRLLDDGEFLV